VCFTELGAFTEGIAYGEGALRIAEAVGQPFTLIETYVRAGSLYLYKGDLPKAISILERGLEVCQATNIPFSFHRIASPLGAVYALSGRVAEAVPLLEQTVERAASWGSEGSNRCALPG
jgi:tetratricopeptide (TPR) repeat protein